MASPASPTDPTQHKLDVLRRAYRVLKADFESRDHALAAERAAHAATLAEKQALARRADEAERALSELKESVRTRASAGAAALRRHGESAAASSSAATPTLGPGGPASSSSSAASRRRRRHRRCRALAAGTNGVAVVGLGRRRQQQQRRRQLPARHGVGRPRPLQCNHLLGGALDVA